MSSLKMYFNIQISPYKLLALLYIVLVTIMTVLLSHSSYAAFSSMPTNLAADGREDSSNPAIVHLSRVGNDATGNGGLLQTTTIKVYYPGDAPPTGDAAKIFVDRIQGSCDLVAYLNGSSGELVRYNTSETCNIMKFQLPSTTAVWKSLSTTEGNFRVATITFKLSDAGEPFNEDSVQNPNNNAFRRTIDINHFSSFNGSRLGFAGGRPVAIDTNSTTGGSTWGFNLAFGVPCNASATKSVTWRDDDQGLDPQHGYVIDTSMSNADTGNVVGSNPSWGGKGLGSMAVSLNSNNRYDWSWTDVYKGNAIRIYYPYDTAWYYLSCLPKSWELGDYSYISSNGYNLGDSHGQMSRPEDGPAPLERFQFINDIRNNGERAISDGYWRCLDNSEYPVADTNPNASGHQTDGWTRYAADSCKDDPDGRRWWLKDNTQQIVFDRSRTGYVDDTFACIGNGVVPGNLLYNDPNGGWNWWDNNAVRGVGCGATPGPHDGSGGQDLQLQASDGGRFICQNGSYYPRYAIEKKESSYDSTKTTGWTLPHDLDEDDRAYMSLCIQVPYYYNLIPTLTLTGSSTGSGTQQGDAIGATGVLTDTSLGNGRQHTNSQEGKVKGVVEFVLPPNTAEPTITGEARVTQEPCTWIGSKGIVVSASNCGRRGEIGTFVPAGGVRNVNGGRTGAETQNLAVGTKLCYSTYVNHPRHINSDDYNSSLGAGLWSYSTVQCRVIIKAPKVQFENSDVTVGRYRSDGQAHTSGGVTSSCEPPVAAATINTSGAPNAVTTRSNPHYYGSWSEYGAFATGGISGFGSAARPFGIGMDNNNGAKRLMFSNTNSGNFRYGGQCLQNPFNRVTLTNSTNLITQTPQAFDSTGRLRLNELAEKYDASFDRTGYVSRGQNVDIAQPGSDIPMTTVVIRAKSKHATGNSGCPKLRVVASRGTTTDQDTKGICSTSFQAYTYQFYMNTDGPQSINAQMVNDAWSPAAPSTANRDLAIESIEVNGQEVYKYGESRPGVTGQRTGSGSCESAAEDGMFFEADAQSATGGTANYCYGMNVAGINAPAQEDPDHGPYNPLPAKSTITVSANAISSNSYAYGASTAGGCPQLYITVIARSGGTSREDLQHICRDTSGWQDYTFTTNIGAKGIESVEVGFDPPDAYGGNPSKDLFVRNININGTDYPTNRSAAIDLRSNNSYKTTTDSSIPDCTNPTDRISMFAAQDSATSSHCVGVRISNVVNPPPPPPPASVLDGNYDRFKGRNIVIYSQKNSPSDTCSPTSDGNLRISQNIAFRKDGYTHVTELPRIVLIADCNITIADNVTEVNATLIAGDAIKTCSQQSRVISQCNQRLRVNGAISANRLLLWRTYGADLVDETAAQIPAESFNLGPSQMVAGYSRGTDSAKPKTVHEIDLPPRY